MSELKVGSTIYQRNGTPVQITGETKVSWIIGDRNWNQEKIKKSAMRKGNSGEYWIQYFVDQSDAQYCVYAAEHRYQIGSLVQRCEDGKLLQEIAKMIGYEVGGKG